MKKIAILSTFVLLCLISSAQKKKVEPPPLQVTAPTAPADPIITFKIPESVVQVILKGLGKLPIDEAGQVYSFFVNETVKQGNEQRAVKIPPPVTDSAAVKK